jgi:hypothetical protein
VLDARHTLKQVSEVADKLGLTDVLTTREDLARAVAPACSGHVFVFAEEPVQQEALEKGGWFRRWFAGKGRGAAGAPGGGKGGGGEGKGGGAASDAAAVPKGEENAKGTGGEGKTIKTASTGESKEATEEADDAAESSCSLAQPVSTATQAQKEEQEKIAHVALDAHGERGDAAGGGGGGGGGNAAAAHRYDRKLVFVGAPPQGWEILRKKLNMSELELVDWNAGSYNIL